jgi:hypothetical protein
LNCFDCFKYTKCQKKGETCAEFFSVNDPSFVPENKYNRSVIGIDGVRTTIDVYRVLVAFSVSAPEIQHAAKKILCAGIRGKGNEEQDISEAILSLQKYQERKVQENAN